TDRLDQQRLQGGAPLPDTAPARAVEVDPVQPAPDAERALGAVLIDVVQRLPGVEPRPPAEPDPGAEPPQGQHRSPQKREADRPGREPPGPAGQPVALVPGVAPLVRVEERGRPIGPPPAPAAEPP